MYVTTLLTVQMFVRICGRSNDCLHMDFPIIVATLPFRIPAAAPPLLHYGTMAVTISR